MLEQGAPETKRRARRASVATGFIADENPRTGGCRSVIDKFRL
jgi:hypothetical protein